MYASEKMFLPEFHLNLCVKIKKLLLLKVIVLTYFNTAKYRAVKEIEFLQQERSLAHKGLTNCQIKHNYPINNRVTFLFFYF